MYSIIGNAFKKRCTIVVGDEFDVTTILLNKYSRKCKTIKVFG